MNFEKELDKFFWWDLKFLLPKDIGANRPSTRSTAEWSGRWGLIEDMSQEKVYELFSKVKTDGIMTILGKDNLILLDIDMKNGKDGTKDLEFAGITEEMLANTYTTTSPSGGVHYIFRSTNEFKGLFAGRNLNGKSYQGLGASEGIDLLMHNPTTILGRGYEPINDTAPRDIPSELIDKLIELVVAKKNASKSLVVESKAHVGARNQQLNLQLFLYYKKNPHISEDELFAEAQKVNSTFIEFNAFEQKEVPAPLTNQELEAVVRSVFAVKVCDDVFLKKVQNECTQDLISQEFKKTYNDLMFYSKEFGFCIYDHNKGFWRKDCEIIIQKEVADFLRKIKEKQQEILDHSLKTKITELENFLGKRMLDNQEELLEESGMAKSTAEIKLAEKTLKQLKALYKSQIKPFLDLQNQYTIKSIVQLLESSTLREDIEFNKDDYLINFKNGTYDLKKNVFRQHFLYDYIDTQSTTFYDKNAKAPQFEKFLSEIFCNDGELIQYVKTMFAYCMTGDMSVQKFFIFDGSGSNGKSVLVNAIKNVMGELVGKFNSENFTAKKNSNNDLLFDLARNKNKRLMLIDEFEKDTKINDRIIKEITGADELTARLMRKDYFTFKPKYKIIITANRKPKIEDTNAIERRIVVIPFNQIFRSQHDLQKMKDAGDEFDEKDILFTDINLSDKLKIEVSGIANILIEHAQLFLKDAQYFEKEPTAIIEARADYMEGARPLKNLIKARYKLFINPDKETCDRIITAGASTFEEFCSDINRGREHAWGKTTIKEVLKDLQIKVSRRGSLSEFSEYVVLLRKGTILAGASAKEEKNTKNELDFNEPEEYLF